MSEALLELPGSHQFSLDFGNKKFPETYTTCLVVTLPTELSNGEYYLKGQMVGPRPEY